MKERDLHYSRLECDKIEFHLIRTHFEISSLKIDNLQETSKKPILNRERANYRAYAKKNKSSCKKREGGEENPKTNPIKNNKSDIIILSHLGGCTFILLRLIRRY